MPDRLLTVVGCGLIGGSFLKAARKFSPPWKLACIDLPERLESIRDSGVAEEVLNMDQAAVLLSQSRLVVLASPVEVIMQHLEQIAPHLSEGCLVTDVGSTKTNIMRKAQETIPAGVGFIGGHPIAGSEQSGIESADPLLFNGRPYLMCPYPDTPVEDLLLMLDIIEDLGATPITIEPEEHDSIMAMVSHVPQLIAVALVHAAMTDDATHGLLDLIVGRGFLDQTRVAASDFKMWKGILETNQEAIMAALDRLDESLQTIRGSMNAEQIRDLWRQVEKRRSRMSVDTIPHKQLKDFRELIDRQDEQLLKVLSRRQLLAKQIGDYKSRKGQAVFDPEREQVLLKKRLDWGQTLDLEPELIEDIFRVITHHSKKKQQ